MLRNAVSAPLKECRLCSWGICMRPQWSACHKSCRGPQARPQSTHIQGRSGELRMPSSLSGTSRMQGSAELAESLPLSSQGSVMRLQKASRCLPGHAGNATVATSAHMNACICVCSETHEGHLLRAMAQSGPHLGRTGWCALPPGQCRARATAPGDLHSQAFSEHSAPKYAHRHLAR